MSFLCGTCCVEPCLFFQATCLWLRLFSLLQASISLHRVFHIGSPAFARLSGILRRTAVHFRNIIDMVVQQCLDRFDDCPLGTDTNFSSTQALRRLHRHISLGLNAWYTLVQHCLFAVVTLCMYMPISCSIPIYTFVLLACLAFSV